jgi:phage baseplate assembly protein W
MADNPHFALPLRFVGTTFVENEQDSGDDVHDCVEAALRTHMGERETLPEFGVHDVTFELQPIQTDRLINDVVRSEPRATLEITQYMDQVDQHIVRLKAKPTRRDPQGA